MKARRCRRVQARQGAELAGRRIWKRRQGLNGKRGRGEASTEKGRKEASKHGVFESEKG